MRYGLAVLVLLFAGGCGGSGEVGTGGMPHIVRTSTFQYQGTVQEVLDAGSYSYIRVTVAGQDRWAVGLKTNLSNGQTAAVRRFGVKSDFCSQRLGRCFEALDFAFLGAAEKP